MADSQTCPTSIIRARMTARSLTTQKDPKLSTLHLGDWTKLDHIHGTKSSTPDKFVIGRGGDCDAIVLHVSISRKHASIIFDRDKLRWTITDHKSSNGVYINGKRIRVDEAVPLVDGDMVELAVGNEFVWMFKTAPDTFKMPKSPICDISNISFSKDRAAAQRNESLGKISLERSLLEAKVQRGLQAQEDLKRAKRELEEELSRKLSEFEEQKKVERENFEKSNQKENENLRKQFEEEMERERVELLKKSEEKELQMKQEVEKAEQNYRDLLREREKMIEMLQAEKEKVEQRYEEERRLFEEKIASLEEKYKNSEKEQNLEYQNDLAKLSSEYEDKLHRGQAALEEAIARQKAEREAEKEAEREAREKMQKELETCQAEVERLKSEQDRKRKRSEEEEAESKRQKDQSRLKLLAKCHEELKCSICDELFIEPMSNPCGHVYCKFCLNQWKSKCGKIGFNCPNCRATITSLTRSLHLENLIDSLIAEAPEEVRADRQTLLKERKGSEISVTRPTGSNNTSQQASPAGSSMAIVRAAASRPFMMNRTPVPLSMVPSIRLRALPPGLTRLSVVPNVNISTSGNGSTLVRSFSATNDSSSGSTSTSGRDSAPGLVPRIIPILSRATAGQAVYSRRQTSQTGSISRPALIDSSNLTRISPTQPIGPTNNNQTLAPPGTPVQSGSIPSSGQSPTPNPGVGLNPSKLWIMVNQDDLNEDIMTMEVANNVNSITADPEKLLPLLHEALDNFRRQNRPVPKNFAFEADPEAVMMSS